MRGLTGQTKPSRLQVVHLGPPKGRGVIARDPIQKGQYVCEYRTYMVYPLHSPLRRELETEYERNGEGSYVLETAHPVKDIGRLCFDAIRRYRDVGRLINHSPRPNLKLGRPHYLREKWRIGLLALYDIPRGQELTYDYGVRAMERKTGKDGTGADGGERGTGGDQGGGNGEGGDRHQREDGGGVSDQREDEGGDGGVAGGSKEKGSAPGPVRRRETGQRKTTTGFKRNYFWCPVRDCASGPVQKMAHTPTSVKMAKRKVRAHSEAVSLRLPNPAKRSSGMRALPLALAPQPSTSKCASPNTTTSKTPSQSAPSKTSTLGAYHSGGAFLEDFFQHLQPHAGGSRNYAPALQLTRAVGKYLHALNPEAVDESRLLEVDPIQGYLTNLTAAGIGASGVLSRILAHKAAIHFMCLTVSYLAYHSLPNMHSCLPPKIAHLRKANRVTGHLSALFRSYNKEKQKKGRDMLLSMTLEGGFNEFRDDPRVRETFSAQA